MKILAIGGSGGMGRHAVCAAQHFDDVEQIVVADLNEASARNFADQLGKKVTAIGLDIENGGALRKAMADADLVMNTSGPFYRYAMQVLQAAIETKCHYLDICDDWEPTVEMLKLDQKAKEAGISATVGLGASPGISNLLALLAMKELDSSSTVYTGWDFGGAKPEGESSQSNVNAAMLHGIEQMTGKVRIFRNGAYELTEPLVPVTVGYPGLTPFQGHIFGHPEAVTFPHNYPQLRESINLTHGGDIDSWLLKAILGLVNQGLVSRSRAAALLTWFENRRGSVTETTKPDFPPAMYGMAIGIKGGEPAIAGAAWFGEAVDSKGDSGLSMGAATGVPLACGAKLLLDGRIKQTGVLTPESGHIDPLEFLREVFRQFESAGRLRSGALEDNVRISRTW
jgi:saccharopine dehydrogenase-like NADP-dependent oxidoreductase